MYQTLSEHTSKRVKVLRDGGYLEIPYAETSSSTDEPLYERQGLLIQNKDFALEINNVAFIYIMRDELGRFTGLYSNAESAV